MKRLKKQHDDRKRKSPGTHGRPFRDLSPVRIRADHKRSVRGMLTELVGAHSTEIAFRLREGMLSPNLRLALKYITFATSYVDGKPVETHRMVDLNEGPTGSYDLGKLDEKQQRSLLKLLKAAKDDTTPSSDK